MPAADALHRFVIEGTDVRGQWVQLGESWRALRAGRGYPDPVRAVLGEAVAATALLAATIKTDGEFILQASGEGPMSMFVVQARGKYRLRGLARWSGEVAGGDLRQLMGSGRLAMTIDPGRGRERYQSIVALGATDLAAALEGYFERSEQLPTRLWLHADARCAGGLLLQRMPGGGEDADAWRRSVHLAETVRPGELLELPARALLRRLFHAEDVRLFDAEPVRFSCDCSRGRVVAVLRALGEEEIRACLAEQGEVSVDCEFCGANYRFDAVDVAQLFAAQWQRPVGGMRH